MPEIDQPYDWSRANEIMKANNKKLFEYKTEMEQSVQRKSNIEKQLEQTTNEITRLNKLKKTLRKQLMKEIQNIGRLASE